MVVGKQDIRLQRVIFGLCRLEGLLAYNANYLPCEPQAGELWVERARIMPKERGYANYTRHAR
jgi:hypothetical protein